MNFDPPILRWRIIPFRYSLDGSGTLFYMIAYGNSRVEKIGRFGKGTFFTISEAMDAIGWYLRNR